VKRQIVCISCALGTLVLSTPGVARLAAQGGADFGLFVEDQLSAHAEQLFGVNKPLAQSALGPFNGADGTQAIELAGNDHPTHLFVCDESSSSPSVQRVDLEASPSSNATTIVTGLSSCDPVRRTPWGTIVVGEETTSGGLYEILSPLSIVSPIAVLNRTTGATSDARVVKRKAVGQLAWEGNVILPDGTMYMGDELRPGSGNPGGGIYKFVPDTPYAGGAPISLAYQSPFASGQLYGLRLGSAGDNGQGTEIGQGAWVPINVATYIDASSNIPLRPAQAALKLTGYYRPEDMERDSLAADHGQVRVCWTATGRMSNGGGSTKESGSIYGEVMCLTDDPNPAPGGGTIPTVQRFIAGDRQANYFDNLAFQPHTGNLIVLEDGEVEVVKSDGTTELRGNDIWLCLPDGQDRDVQSDGCIRVVSLKDTSSEPTGFIFTGDGRAAFVNLQHRATGVGALLKITGFKVPE
jgi:secreted PhoX family phosphatase